ncbi:MAG: N-acetylglucosamine-6-phosphate deacetylase [Planctomycetaceae bacterium]|nr:MAG: N-acetylglucosamine-6-phosphate deacetylase [Planctomycetaceae bacterium]
MLTLRARRFETGEPVCVHIEGERISRVEPTWPSAEIENWPWVAPGFFDVQINGHSGIWFSDGNLTVEQALRAVHALLAHGITQVLPTLITNAQEALLHALNVLRQACEVDDLARRMVAGFHLEGPYISADDGPRGAHPREHVRPADWKEFSQLQEAAGGRIRLVTLAPEVSGALDFIRRAVAAGVVVALGHTAAPPELIRAAVDAGARLSTHLGNGSATFVHRHHNVFWEQLADTRLFISLIVDGHHLPEAMVRTMLAAKTPRRIILTCDAAGWAGCPPGVYENNLGRSEILVDGKLVVAGQRELLAGSAFETDWCVQRMRQITALPWREIIPMTSKYPAQLLGTEYPKLRRGGLANLIVFSHDPQALRLNIQATILQGRTVFGSVPVLD